MSSVAYVTEASGWAEELITNASRRPGDFDNAMAAVARRLRIPYSKLWALRYRPPKTIDAFIYDTLHDAVHPECRRLRSAASFARTRDADIEKYRSTIEYLASFDTSHPLSDTQFHRTSAPLGREATSQVGRSRGAVDENPENDRR